MITILNYNIVMKKQLPDKQYVISDFQFSIYPKTLTFHSPSQQNYTLYLEKGAQVIGKYQQMASSEKKNFVFSVIQRKNFRIFNEKSNSYQWSIYSVQKENKTQQFLQTSMFSIQKAYSTYIGYFNQAQAELRKNYKSKQNAKVQQIWKDIKKMVQNEAFVQSSLFKNSAIVLEFQIQMKCEFDFMLEAYQSRKLQLVKFKETQLRRKQSQSINDSRMKNSQASFDSKKQQKIIVQPKRESGQKNLQLENKKQSPIKQFNEDIRQSQIQIFDPQGAKIDLQNSSDSRARLSKSTEDYNEYQKRRNSLLLSDIIQQSYQGSSNINASKSNGQQKLKSIDVVNEVEQECHFSPVVRTQTFQSEKFDEIINFKRTATLRHKTSKDYELEQHRQEAFQQIQEDESCKYSHLQDQLQQSVQNVNIQKVNARKKLIIILLVIVFFTSLIGGVYWKSNNKKVSKSYKNRQQMRDDKTRATSKNKERRSESKKK